MDSPIFQRTSADDGVMLGQGQYNVGFLLRHFFSYEGKSLQEIYSLEVNKSKKIRNIKGLQDSKNLEYFLLRNSIRICAEGRAWMFWIISSVVSILFVIFFMSMLIAGRRADETSRNHFAEFSIIAKKS